MCGSLSLTLAAITTLFCMAAGRLQLVFMGLTAAFAAAGLVLWLLRGPPVPVLPGDYYWNRAMARVFVMIFALSALGAMSGISRWSKNRIDVFSPSGPEFAKSNGRDRSRVFVGEDISTSEEEEGIPRERHPGHEYRVPAIQYDLLPLATVLVSMLAIGALSETKYRKCTARRALELHPEGV
jgi:hypothetical protein